VSTPVAGRADRHRFAMVRATGGLLLTSAGSVVRTRQGHSSLA
jgi:hypothetical protein